MGTDGTDEGRLRLLWDAWRTKRGGSDAVAERQRERLAGLVAFARAHSPYYAALYRGLPERVKDPVLLPVTSKKALMARFDEWVTDREATLDRVRAFAADPALVGERFLGRYTLATTSGTTGTPGLFLVDDRAMAVTGALASRMLAAWLAAGDVARIVAGGGRMSMVMASGGHFASAAAAARLRKGRWGRSQIQVLSVHMPLPELVARLNKFQPVVVAPYASLAALLAGEQEAGRLRIRPALLALSAEGLPQDEYGRIARAFGAKVGNSYAATECPFLSYSCRYGWLHVNADWAVLEPVDAEDRPVPPGTQSHTVLLTNLANRVQPILRYDLGDSVLERPDPCPCGNPLPAIRVQGRAADVLVFPAEPTEGAGRVTIAPLAFGTLADAVPGLELFQLVQTSPTTLHVRLRPEAGADPERVWQALRGRIARLLGEHGLRHVTVERAQEPPEQSAGGKYRKVIPLS